MSSPAPFHRVDYAGSRGGARVFDHTRMRRLADRPSRRWWHHRAQHTLT